MNPKALAQYQASQQKSAQQILRLKLDVIMKRGGLYNLAFLQNEALLENFINTPNITVSSHQIEQLEKVLLWLEKTQEGAKVS